MRSLPGVWDKKIEQIEQEFAQKIPRPLRRVIHALCIRHIGEVSSRDLVEAWLQTVGLDDTKKDLSNFLHFVQDTEHLSKIYWFGPEMVASLVAFFHDTTNQKIFSRCDSWGMIDWLWTWGMNSQEKLLAGINVVVTWSFACGRDRLENYLRELWATLQAGVSSTTHALIAGEGWWSKRAKAQERGITIHTAESFFDAYWLLHEILVSGAWSNWEQITIQQTSLFG